MSGAVLVVTVEWGGSHRPPRRSRSSVRTRKVAADQQHVCGAQPPSQWPAEDAGDGLVAERDQSMRASPPVESDLTSAREIVCGPHGDGRPHWLGASVERLNSKHGGRKHSCMDRNIAASAHYA